MQSRSYLNYLIIGLLIAVIIFFALWILLPFSKAILWAIIFAVVCVPLYNKLQSLFIKRSFPSFLFTVLIAVCVLLPILLILFTVSQEIASSIEWIKSTDIKQIQLPQYVNELPLIGKKVNILWQTYIQQPQKLFANVNQAQATTWFNVAKGSLAFIFAQAETLFFMLISLFFIFRDGVPLAKKIQASLEKHNPSYNHFIKDINDQLLGITRSFFYIGFGSGLLMTILYIVLKLPVPFLLGAITAMCSIIPFTQPILYVILTLYLLLQGKIVAGVCLIVIGMTLNQLNDNWLQPYLIGKNTRMHFLTILFGILGGVRVFGLIGIFIGPIILNLAIRLIKLYIFDRKAA